MVGGVVTFLLCHPSEIRPSEISPVIGPAVRADFQRLYPANAKTPTCCPSDDNRTKVTNSVTSARSLWWHVGPVLLARGSDADGEPHCMHFLLGLLCLFPVMYSKLPASVCLSGHMLCSSRSTLSVWSPPPLVCGCFQQQIPRLMAYWSSTCTEPQISAREFSSDVISCDRLALISHMMSALAEIHAWIFCSWWKYICGLKNQWN